MMASKPSGRRAKIASSARRRWLPWILGIVLGVVAGGGMTKAYAPPNADVIRVQAADWYHHMRDLITPGTRPAPTKTWVGEPKIYATDPIALPPENTTDRDQVADDVDKLINVNAPIPDTGQLTTALDEARANLALNHRMLVVDA